MEATPQQVLKHFNSLLRPLGLHVNEPYAALKDGTILLRLLESYDLVGAIDRHQTPARDSQENSPNERAVDRLGRILDIRAKENGMSMNFEDEDLLGRALFDTLGLVISLCALKNRDCWEKLTAAEDVSTEQLEKVETSNALEEPSEGQDPLHLDGKSEIATTNEPITTSASMHESNLSHQGPNEGDNTAKLDWLNYHLGKVDLKAENLDSDFQDGFLLILLIEVITEKPIENYRSRVTASESISNPEWIKENQELIFSWLSEEQQVNREVPVDDLVDSVLWKLLSINVGAKLNQHDSDTCIKLARSIFKAIQLPFFFDGLNLKGKGVAVLLAASILQDKFTFWKTQGKHGNRRKWVPRPQNYKTSNQLSSRIIDEGVLRIFLSSTFRDMQHERDQFFQYGVPELKIMAKTKGLDLVFIDLRWGLTAQDSSDGWVVVRCCDSIKKCAYFVCFLGARYGWVPDPTKTELNKEQRLEELKKTKPEATMDDIWVEWHSETNKRYPFLDEIPGLSVTEYEIQFAALIGQPACSRVFFYFRDEEYAVKHAQTEDEKKLYQAESCEAAARQQLLKDNIKSRYGAVLYRGAAEFSNFVSSHLRYAIEDDFSGHQVREPEEQAHYQFMQHRLAGFEGRKDLLRLITSQVLEQLNHAGHQITVLAAESGIGKSSLMAATVRELQAMKLSDVCIFYHFVGCTNLSNYVESISIRFWKSVAASESLMDLDLSNMTDMEFQKEGLIGLMKLLKTTRFNKRFIFLVDAVNQLQPSQDTPVPNLLTWLPKTLPNNIAMVVSTIDTHSSCASILTSGLQVIPVTKLSPDEIRQGTKAFLVRYDKKLSEEQMQMILNDFHDTGHPLYLRLVLDEIRVFGVYEKLNDEICSLLSTNGVIELYNMIITRWQIKFDVAGTNIVELAMKVLFVSRIGLSEGDIDKYVKDMIGIRFNLAEWKSFFFTLVDSLFVRNGRYMYFHQLLLETASQRFFSDKNATRDTQKQYGMWLLGQYADAYEIDEEVVAEICFQLLLGECYDALVEYLKKEYVVVSMLGSRYRYEFFNCWRTIQSKGAGSYKDTYGSLIKSITKAGDMLVEYFVEAFENSFLVVNIPQRIAKRSNEESKAGDYLTLGRVYKNMQNWGDALSAFQRCLDIKLHLNGKDESLALLHDEMGEIHLKQKRLDLALTSFEESLSIRQDLFGNLDLRVAQSYDNFGAVSMAQDNYKKAEADFTSAKLIRTKLVGNDHPLMATSLINMSRVHEKEKRFVEAIHDLETAHTILKSTLGGKHPLVGSVFCRLADIHEAQESVGEAIEKLQYAGGIFEQAVGENHPNTVSTYQKIGDLATSSKNYQGALSAYVKILEIRKRTLPNDHVEVATAMENVGRTNLELKRNNQVSEYIIPALKIRKETNTRPSLQSGSQCMRIAKLLMRMSELEHAVEFYKTACIRYCQTESHDSWNAWIACERIEEIFERESAHKQAVEFWTEMRDFFMEAVGISHDRTLLCCEYLSTHYKYIGKNILPIQLTRVEEFVEKHTGFKMLVNEFESDKITDALLAIVYSSRTDPSNKEKSSAAATLLNFMNVSLAGLDLSNVQIPDANLTRSNLDGTNFTNANLNRVKLNHSCIGNCILDDATLEGVQLGLPHSKFKATPASILSVCSLQGPTGEIWLASSGPDCLVRIWDVANAKEIKCLSSHTGSVTSLCAVRGPKDENWLASGSADKTIALWNLADFTLIRTFQGHSRAVVGVYNFAGPNGVLSIASSSEDKTIRIWEVETGQVALVLEGHTWTVHCTTQVQGPNGECWLASGGHDKTIRIWDLSTGSEVKVLQGHSTYVTELVYIPKVRGQSWLVSSSEDKTIRTWDIHGGGEWKILGEHEDHVKSICFIPGPNNECWIASVSDDKSIKLWDLETSSLLKTFNKHTGPIYCVCSIFGPNGERWIASGSRDKNVRLWEVTSGMEIKSTSKYVNSVRHACEAISPSGKKYIASGCSDHILRVYEQATGLEIATLEGHTDSVRSICSVNGPQGEVWLASGGDDKTIRVWDLEKKAELQTLSGHIRSIRSICNVNGPDGEMWLASGSVDKTIRIWDITKKTKMDRLLGHTGSVRSVCEVKGPNGECWLASGSDDKVIKVWDVAERKEVLALTGHTRDVRSICSVNGPNGESWLVSGSADATIRVWDLSTGTEVMVFSGHKSDIRCVCSVQGPGNETLLASGSVDKTIKIWNLATQTEVKTLTGHLRDINSVCGITGPKGEHWLASGSWDKTIRIWDLGTGSEVKILGGHTESIYSICGVRGLNGEFWLASGSEDTTVRLWDLATGTEINKLKGHTSYVRGVCSIKGPNGELWLASAGWDNILRVWDLGTGTEIKTLKGHHDAVYGVTSIRGPQGECLLASGSADKGVIVWDLGTGAEVCSLIGHGMAVSKVCSVRGLQGESLLASGGYDNTVRLWSLSTRSEVARYHGAGHMVVSLCQIIGPDGEICLAAATEERRVCIWDLSNGKILYKLGCSELAYNRDLCLVRKHPHGETIGRFRSFEDAVQFMEPNSLFDVRTNRMIGSYSLKGGNMHMKNTQGLASFNKTLLLRSGAASFDNDFIRHCESQDVSDFQARMMAMCYTEGIAVEKNHHKAEEWLQSASMRAEKE
eukprot:TRINITY_DN6756_c0_g1_i10.p1 TRINITY_DN6756_c0_g1~~TRINITY_DN6756_c0_g1_i10.p1  ORF type:complete len:2620 (-),score=451.36 TRINITY_DN6756_c0_g1_i10:125-7984(-)